MAREQPTVAYLGPKSSFTNQAARSLFPESEFYLAPRSTIRDVFNAVKSGVVDRGVVPFENSSHGAVLSTLDLLFDRREEYSDVYVSGEVSLQVNHCLIGYPALNYHESTSLMTPPESPTLSPADVHQSIMKQDFKHIKYVYSHPQALGQCEDFLSKYLPHVTRIRTSSTAQAALIAAQDSTRQSTAIASARSINTPGIKGASILAKNMQDMVDNQTRFFIIKKFTPLWHYDPSWVGNTSEDETMYRSEGFERSMLASFSVDPRSRSSLADALSIFSHHKVNVTSIFTRPSRKYAWHNRHIVEFDFAGSKTGEGCTIDKMLKDLSEVTRDYRVHGAWEKEFVW